MNFNVIQLADDDILIITVHENVTDRAKQAILDEYTKYFKNIIVQSATTSVTVLRKKDLV